ncbi:MAG: HlyD family secretion protein [Marinilabiliales bacterium]|nr:MAG: HlyD family secretion protein [Marinilabiliales bacterium]
MKKYIFLLLIAALLASCSSSEPEADAYGNFESDEILISAEVSGKIIAMNVDEGDPVSPGDVLAAIDSVPLFLKLETYEAQRSAILSRGGNVYTQSDVLEQQKANLEKELARVEALLKDGAATEKQKDEIVYQIQVLDRQIANVRSQNTPISAEASAVNAQIDILLDQIARCQVKAPVQATVLSRFVNAGEVVGAGKPMFKIANLDKMYLKAYVSGSQLSSIQIGQVVKVRIDDSEDGFKVYDGKITWISSQAEFTPKIIQTKEERVNFVYAIKVLVPNDGSIKIGMPGEVVFE